MSDVRRIVSIPASGTPVIELDLEDKANGIYAERSTFKLTAPGKRARQVSSERPYGGQRTVGMAHDNALIGGTWRVAGTGPVDAADKWEEFVASIDSAGINRYFEWIADGLPYPTFWEIRGPGTWDLVYVSNEFRQLYAASYQASWPVAPLGCMHQLDIDDVFTDLSLWTFDEGAT